MALWPWAERRLTHDYAFHNLLERPRDNPWRTATGIGAPHLGVPDFVSGSADRVYVLFGISYASQIWFYRVAVWVIPLIVFFVTKRVCEELRDGERVARVRHAAEREAAPVD